MFSRNLPVSQAAHTHHPFHLIMHTNIAEVKCFNLAKASASASCHYSFSFSPALAKMSILVYTVLGA